MGEEHSFSLTTFSPTGKLVQIEHALAAVHQQGRPALAVKSSTGVVLATEKKLGSSLIDGSSLSKVVEIDSHVMCVYAGMPGDFRSVLANARKQAAQYRLTYGEPVPILILVKSLANLMQEFTQSGGVRPFGCSLLVAGVDDCPLDTNANNTSINTTDNTNNAKTSATDTRDGKTVGGTSGGATSGNGKGDGDNCMSDGYQAKAKLVPHLFQVDPSGAYFAWKATAIGKEMATAKTVLERRYQPSMSQDDAIHTAILTLKEVLEDTLTESNVEIGIVSTHDGKARTLKAQEIKDYLAETD